MSVVYLVGRPTWWPQLMTRLKEHGVPCDSAVSGVEPLLRRVYDGRGLVLVDAADAGGQVFLEGVGKTFATVVAVAFRDELLPDEVLRLSRDLTTDEAVHHLKEVLAEAAELRRHPRVPIRLQVETDTGAHETLDVSLYGLRLAGAAVPFEGSGSFILRLHDGAGIKLRARRVGARSDAVAFSVRPEDDADLVLWLDLLLSALKDSPLHADADPFGPLFLPPDED